MKNRSPFQLLEPFPPEAGAAFFGREKEAAALMDLARKNKLVVVHGAAYSGKTSLVQCGLTARFDPADWLPVFIRREENLPDSLRRSLQKCLPSLPPGESLAHGVEAIYGTFLRPVYLIFDQLEELFLLGTRQEQEQFLADLASLFRSNSPCRILLVLREECLADLLKFEKTIGAPLDRRFRLEPMRPEIAQEALRQTCQQFNLTIHPAAVDNIIGQVSEGNQAVSLPLLQIFMDVIYREAAGQFSPGDYSETELPHLLISRAAVEKWAGMEQVLEDFLTHRETEIQLVPGSVHGSLVSYLAQREKRQADEAFNQSKRQVETQRQQLSKARKTTHQMKVFSALVGALACLALVAAWSGFLGGSSQNTDLLVFQPEPVPISAKLMGGGSNSAAASNPDWAAAMAAFEKQEYAATLKALENVKPDSASVDSLSYFFYSGMAHLGNNQFVKAWQRLEQAKACDRENQRRDQIQWYQAQILVKTHAPKADLEAAFSEIANAENSPWRDDAAVVLEELAKTEK